jgi:hypothetical protein
VQSKITKAADYISSVRDYLSNTPDAVSGGEEEEEGEEKEEMKEATSTNDPNRGRAGRAKPKLPPGQDPYDMYTKGAIKPYGGKTQKRLGSLSPESRKRYYQEVGIRSRAASRAGTTGRLHPQG